MLAADLDYFLPPELIAQEPVEPRDHSRLMVVRRSDGSLNHHRFDELPQLLRPDDLLVFNDTRVLRARLRGTKAGSGGRVEALLLREVEMNLWEALLKPSARLWPGTLLQFASPDSSWRVPAQAVERTKAGWLVRFAPGAPEPTAHGGHGADIRDWLPRLGEVPLPPYIHRAARDEAQYQTVYARRSAGGQGDAVLDSAAAPTAGLHFSPALLEALRARGVGTAYVTLGIGIGTFRPIQTTNVEEHIMHHEEFSVPAATAGAIAAQRKRGGRVVAVGTTTTRVLESVADAEGCVAPGSGSTDIFMRPGYRFRCVDALLTNFHLPRSTLLAMIAAFAESEDEEARAKGGAGLPELTGVQKIRYAYSQAIAARYRFFSFGDAMLIE